SLAEALAAAAQALAQVLDGHSLTDALIGVRRRAAAPALAAAAQDLGYNALPGHGFVQAPPDNLPPTPPTPAPHSRLPLPPPPNRRAPRSHNPPPPPVRGAGRGGRAWPTGWCAASSAPRQGCSLRSRRPSRGAIATRSGGSTRCAWRTRARGRRRSSRPPAIR